MTEGVNFYPLMLWMERVPTANFAIVYWLHLECESASLPMSCNVPYSRSIIPPTPLLPLPLSRINTYYFDLQKCNSPTVSKKGWSCAAKCEDSAFFTPPRSPPPRPNPTLTAKFQQSLTQRRPAFALAAPLAFNSRFTNNERPK